MNRIFIIAPIIFLFSACGTESAFEKENNSHFTIDLGGESIQFAQQQRVSDAGQPNNFYSRVDSILQYGFGADQYYGDSLKDCDLKLIVSGKFRETENPFSGTICFSLYDNRDTIMYWGEVHADKFVLEKNNWIAFKDSLFIEKNRNTFNSKFLRVFSRKQSGKGFFDVDDLKIEFIKVQ